MISREALSAWARRTLIGSGLVVLLSACGPTAGPGASPTPTPTPGPKLQDLKLWTMSTLGTGPSVAPDGDGVDFLIPAGATVDPQKHFATIGLQAKCNLSGDFDLQVDYRLINWPAHNSVRVGLGTGTYSVQRASNVGTGVDNVYVIDFAGNQPRVETQDVSGGLRLTRIGDMMSAYYRSNGGWVMLASAKGPTDPTPFSVAAWTDYDVVVKSDVKVNLTHLTILPAASACT